jgi:teichuronic acid biosynthesis glycosyltransferase TuaC
VNLLLIPSSYPHAAYPYAGIFNERCALALKALGGRVEVFAPRPYAPAFLAGLSLRWKNYAGIPGQEVRNAIRVSRPSYLQVPRIATPFWSDTGAYYFVRRAARRMHRREPFDAILSFDLAGTGGLAWRLGRDLGIPAAGWATGSDVRTSRTSSIAAAIRRSVSNLGLVFYQSEELLGEVARLLELPKSSLEPSKHVVLPRGIPEPPAFSRIEVRKRVRSQWKIEDDEILVLMMGRLLRSKGVFEVLEAIALAAARVPRITAVLVGAMPGFDDRESVDRLLRENSGLRRCVQIFPACDPSLVWDCLSAADLFAFGSHREGMPNSLLEAMAMGIPSIAFAIPPVREIDAGTGALALVPPLDAARFSEEIVRLASDPLERRRLGELGRAEVLKRFLVDRNMATALARLSGLVIGRASARENVEGACVSSGG